MFKRYFSLLVGINFLFVFLANPSWANSSLEQHFQKQLDSIEQFMAKQQETALQKPGLLFDFIDNQLMSVWSAELTIKAMVGVKRWKKIEQEQQFKLITAYHATMHRYLYETLQKYSGQRAKVSSIKLNNKQTKGWVTVKVSSPILPAINVDLKIYKQNFDWKIYDFRLHGISFIKMKQQGYRKTIDSFGVSALIKELNDKNQLFIETSKGISSARVEE